MWEDSNWSLLEFHKGGSSREAYEDCFQPREKPTPLNDKGAGAEKRERGQDSAASLPTTLPPLLLTELYQSPFLFLQKQTTQYAPQPPKRLKCCRPVGMELWLDSEQQYAASPLSLSSLSHKTYHPHTPISLAYSTLLQNVFVLRLGCVRARTNTHQSPAHCWHHLPS